MFETWLFVVPLWLSLILFLFYQGDKLKSYTRRIHQEMKKKPQNKVYRKMKLKYEQFFLSYSKKSFENVLRIKLVIFIVSLSLIFTFKITNIYYYSNQIERALIYRVDAYSNINISTEASLQEIEIFRKFVDNMPEDIYKQSPEDIKFQIQLMIQDPLMPIEELINRVYYRVTDYYMYQQWNPIYYVLAAVLITFSTEIFFGFQKLNSKSKAHQEIRFLKRLIILYGSIKPVKFLDLLTKIRQKSFYHQKFFETLYEANIQTNISLKKVYQNYIKQEKDLDIKLFYEKLDQANNYDFDQAIINIKNEFRLDRKARERRIKKRIEQIEIVAQIGIMVLITTVVALYFLKPWLDSTFI